MTRYPWHERYWRQLSERFASGKLPHALLISGAAGMGKRTFAEQFAQALLCASPGSLMQPCGECKPCVLFAAGNHPDYALVAPEEEGKRIPVDAIRGLSEFLTLTQHYGPHKLALIAPADAMNRNAADALLKTLEEPPANSVLLLLSERPALLPATIRSRCQQLRFSQPPVDDVKAWLKDQLKSDDDLDMLLDLSGNSPLQVLALKEQDYRGIRDTVLRDLSELAADRSHPVVIAEQWAGMDNADDVLKICSTLLRDLGRIRLGAAKHFIDHEDRWDSLQELSKRIDLHAIFRISDSIFEALGLLQGTTNVRTQDLLEEISFEWHAATHVAR
jgi:DNA polymerase-3 subunit delta'